MLIVVKKNVPPPPYGLNWWSNTLTLLKNIVKQTKAGADIKE